MGSVNNTATVAANSVVDKVMALKLEDVMSVYSGKAGHCCCGCQGKHSYALKHRDIAGKDRGYKVDDDQINDRMVSRVVKILKEHAEEVVDASDSNIGRNFSFTTHNSRGEESRLYIVYLLPKEKLTRRRV